MPARIPAMSKVRAKKIKLLLFDVDGVLTDGKIWILPAPQSTEALAGTGQADHGRPVTPGRGQPTYWETKGFHAHDGTAVSLARLGGIRLGLITKRISETVALRARDLKIEHVYQGIQDKHTVFEQILSQEGFAPDEAAYVGDDVIDLPVMRHCGLSIAVPNARDEVKDEAHYITHHAGGEGALRDAVEYILKAQGKWRKVVDQYIAQRNPAEGPAERSQLGQP